MTTETNNEVIEQTEQAAAAPAEKADHDAVFDPHRRIRPDRGASGRSRRKTPQTNGQIGQNRRFPPGSCTDVTRQANVRSQAKWKA